MKKKYALLSLLDTLKSCPFCKANKAQSMCEVDRLANKARYWIECNKCHARSGTRASLPSAITAWNRRPDDGKQ